MNSSPASVIPPLQPGLHQDAESGAIPRQRKRGRDEDATECDDTATRLSTDRPSKRARSEYSMDRAVSTANILRLACPYLVNDPVGHPHCFLAVLRDMTTLRQHLRRYHWQPVHCPRCGQQFSGSEAQTKCDEHVRGNCVVWKFPPLEGLCEKTYRQIYQACRKHQDDIERWKVSFKIIFGTESPTNNPWIGPPQLELPRHLMSQWRRGPDLTRVLGEALSHPSAKILGVVELAQELSSRIGEAWDRWLKENFNSEHADEDDNQIPPEASTHAGGCHSNDFSTIGFLPGMLGADTSFNVSGSFPEAGPPFHQSHGLLPFVEGADDLLLSQGGTDWPASTDTVAESQL
jgi:uncharacterized Zn-finger protein